jgi:hypothetical protein
MVTVYLDETQQNTPAAYAFVAGFRGTDDEWNCFLPKWTSALGGKKSLHLTDLRWNSGRGKNRVRDLLAKLGPIPYECGLVPVFGGVRVSDYFDLIEGDSEFERKVQGYTVCLAAVFCLLMGTLQGHEQLKVVCEAQDNYEPKARKLFKVFRHLAGQNPLYPTLTSIEFVPKNTFLEPADFFAFALGKKFNEPNTKKDLWCNPIHDENYQIPCRAGLWMDRKVARETIEMIKADVKARAGSSLLRNAIESQRIRQILGTT